MQNFDFHNIYTLNDITTEVEDKIFIEWNVTEMVYFVIMYG